MKLGYGNYGMPKLTVAESVQATAAIGYDGIELCLLPNAPGTPNKLPATERTAIRAAIETSGIEVPAFMLGLNALADDQAAELARLTEAMDYATDLGLDPKPVLVTTTGGNPRQWESHCHQLADNIREWTRLAADTGFVLALEPHVGGVICRPEQAEWVRAQIDSPALKFNYDESHFQLRGLDAAESAAIMVPHAVATHLKDAAGDADHVTFLLPGDGDFDNAGFVRLLADLGYDGYLTVEVSGMVWQRPDYDAVAAATACYETLTRALADAGVARG